MADIRGFLPSSVSPYIGSNVTTIVTPGASTLDWAGRPVIRRISAPNATTGGHVMIYRRGSAHNVNDGALYIKFRSTSGTWSTENQDLLGNAISGFPLNPPVSAGEDAGEPQLTEAPNGDLILHSWRVDYNVANKGTYQWRDTGHIGQSWTSEGLVDFSGTTDDLNVFSTDDFFVYGSDIYAVARHYTTVNYAASALYLIRSSDNGATWTIISTIIANNEGTAGTGGHEGGLTLRPDLSIYAVIRDIECQVTYSRIAQPPYTSWGTLTNVSSTIGISGRHRIYGVHELQGASNWWLDRRRLMVGFVFTSPGSSQGRRNAIWASKNAGSTWKLLYVDNSAEDGGYGDLAWDPVARKWVYMSYKGTLAQADVTEYLLDIKGFS